jgi:hypothetical protein
VSLENQKVNLVLPQFRNEFHSLFKVFDDSTDLSSHSLSCEAVHSFEILSGAKRVTDLLDSYFTQTWIVNEAQRNKISEFGFSVISIQVHIAGDRTLFWSEVCMTDN